MAESDTNLDNESGMHIVDGSMKVNGNLETTGQTTTQCLKVLEGGKAIMSTAGRDMIQFNKAVEFSKNVQFNDGQTVIGMETRLNKPYVGSPVVQAGSLLVIGDSLMKVDAESCSIVADRFRQTLDTLVADRVLAKKTTSDLVDAKDMKVTGEFIGNELFADTIKTSNLYMESFTGINLSASNSITTKDIVVNGLANIQNSVTILGRSSINGAALTVNGGQIIANKGIVSHTRNNSFQCMEIIGSGTPNDVCFRIDKDVDSLIEGNVTIQDSNLILDNSRLATDNVIVTPLNSVKEDEPTSGVQITTSSDWDTYQGGMVEEIEPQDQFDEDDYNPYEEVESAMGRTTRNYESIDATVKCLTDPINYLMERTDSSVPKRFNVNRGVYRMDASGNALFRNLISERGRFSELEAWKLNVNQLKTDKLVLTSVASNVVDTDNLLRSRGIAEFEGAVNTSADVFVEEGSKVNVASGAEITLQDGASLKLKNGASLEMGTQTAVKMQGDIELDLTRLVFLDSTTGRKFRIQFRDAHESEGTGVVMEYSEVSDSETPTQTTQRAALDVRELSSKLKQLGI